MNDYRDWLVVTRDALETTCRMMQITLTDQERVALMTRYIELPAFDDVKPALTALGHSEHRMSAFSNALPGALRALLQHAGIADLLQTPISVHDIRSLKPDPAAYAHFNAKTGSVAEDTWLVSSNPYDICGAVAFGWRAAWLRRSSRSVFDRWEYMPTETIDSLSDLTHIP